jgi:lipoate-protein ligase B
MQRALVEERRAGRVPDLLVLLQHPAVITLGVRAMAAAPTSSPRQSGSRSSGSRWKRRAVVAT